MVWTACTSATGSRRSPRVSVAAMCDSGRGTAPAGAECHSHPWPFWLKGLVRLSAGVLFSPLAGCALPLVIDAVAEVLQTQAVPVLAAVQGNVGRLQTREPE